MAWLDILGWGKEELEDLRFVGYSYLKQGKYEVALTFFEALVTLNPESSYDLQTLGALHLQEGNDLIALSWIEKALQVEPDHLPTRLNKAKALFALGYHTKGVEEATILTRCADPLISDQAEALLLAYPTGGAKSAISHPPPSESKGSHAV